MALFPALLIIAAPAGTSAEAVLARLPAPSPPTATRPPFLEPEFAGLAAFGQPLPQAEPDAPPAEGMDRAAQGEDYPAEIVVTAEEAPPQDPLQRLNAETFEVVQDVDRALVEPVAKGYRDGLPKPLRKGLSNFFRNLREPIVFVNFLLQGKPGKAAETVGRFVLNTTIGVAGLVDMAKKKPFHLPYRNNGFGNTLGFYGVKPGPFLVVPLIGPTTVRDLLGSGVDTLVLPTAVGAPFDHPAYAVTSYVVRSLDERIEFDGKLKAIRDSDYPYATMRETYLCERQAAIDELRGRPKADCSLPPPPDYSGAEPVPLESPSEPGEQEAGQAAPPF